MRRSAIFITGLGVTSVLAGLLAPTSMDEISSRNDDKIWSDPTPARDTTALQLAYLNQLMASGALQVSQQSLNQDESGASGGSVDTVEEMQAPIVLSLATINGVRTVQVQDPNSGIVTLVAGDTFHDGWTITSISREGLEIDREGESRKIEY